MDEKITIDSFNFYKESLYYLCNLLIPNLEYYLQEEGRYYGRVKSYLDSIKLAEKNGKEKIDDTNTIHYGKVVSLVKNQIKRDFQRLSKRRMSCADRIIILMRWILNLIKKNKIKAAEAFILYRKKREEIRDEKSWLTKEITKKLNAKDVENQNANLDEASFGGRIGEASRVVTKNMALKHMSKQFRDNHNNNEDYIHKKQIVA